jgi:sugar lactone lactonase YvrE
MRRATEWAAWVLVLPLAGAAAPQAPPERQLPVESVAWPEETRCLEMFSAMATGPDGRVYAGTCNALKIGARLIAFDPVTKKQEILADMQAVCGEEGSKTFPQSKIHSQICFDSKGVAWFGTHSYDWSTLEQFKKSPGDYTGGHLVTYDTATRKATDLGILVPHESIMSLALAEGVGKVYCVLHPTGRFVVYDIRTKTVKDKGMLLGYPCRALVALKDGRGFTFSAKGEVVRYSPDTDRYEKLGAAIPPGDPPPNSSDGNNPFALAVSEDQKRIYGTGWSSGFLFEYRPDDGPDGRLRTLGVAFGDETVPGGRRDLCIAMATGRDGRIYYAGYDANRGRVACYDPAADRRVYLGRMTVDGTPIGLKSDRRGSCGAMCALNDGRLVATDFDQKQTWYNLFKPAPK